MRKEPRGIVSKWYKHSIQPSCLRFRSRVSAIHFGSCQTNYQPLQRVSLREKDFSLERGVEEKTNGGSRQLRRRGRGKTVWQRKVRRHIRCTPGLMTRLRTFVRVTRSFRGQENYRARALIMHRWLPADGHKWADDRPR